jgi:hypothetical protein
MYLKNVYELSRRGWNVRREHHRCVQKFRRKIFEALDAEMEIIAKKFEKKGA